MVLFNYSTRELTAKVVYYGPGLCGKTSNLQYVYDNLPKDVSKGKMLSLATKTDRTLFFDFLPLDLGMIRGMKTRIQLYTVPGQVFYNSTRKMVLKGADGVVFVADSQAKMMDANIESFTNLEENLAEQGMRLDQMPLVLQFNKRDLPNLASIEELNSQLNKYNAPFYEAIAISGIGVHDTLKAATKLVLNSLTNKYRLDKDKEVGVRAGARPSYSPAPPPATPAPAQEPQLHAAAPVAVAQEEPEEEVLELVEESESEDVLEIVEEPSAPDPGATMRLSAAMTPDPASDATDISLGTEDDLEQLEIIPIQDGADSPAEPATAQASPTWEQSDEESLPVLEDPVPDSFQNEADAQPIVLKVNPGESPVVTVPLRIEYGKRTLQYRLQIHLQSPDER